jgi:hypothetical protein
LNGNIKYLSLGGERLPRDREYKAWLQAHIALKQEVLGTLTEKESRSVKEGQIALLELQLKELRKK